MTKIIELHLREQIIARARRLAQERHCAIEDVFEEAIARMAAVEVPVPSTPEDPFLGMFKDEPDLVDQVTRSAMEARERHPLRSAGA